MRAAKAPSSISPNRYKEIGGRGITVNCVAPGPLKTSFFYPAETDENIAWLKSMSINGDIGEPTDIVPVIGL